MNAQRERFAMIKEEGNSLSPTPPLIGKPSIIEQCSLRVTPPPTFALDLYNKYPLTQKNLI